MRTGFRIIGALALLGLFIGNTAYAIEPGGKQMPNSAEGYFEVELEPLALHAEGENLGRVGISKVFHGELEGKSQGEMLTARTGNEGSAVYVAIERVTGTLDGRQGSFVLHHRGIMERGENSLEIHVVPDSGTDELQGITGELTIRIEDGKHYYVFSYELP